MQTAARIVAVALLSVLAGCETMSNPAQQASDSPNGASVVEAVPGQYIVVLQNSVADPASVASDLVNAAGGSLLQVYTTAIKGFAARLSAPAAEALGRNPLVASVEADQVMRADVTQSMDANGDPWGLDRIDQNALPLSRTYTYTSTGAGVHAYIIDTGIWTLQSEFGGRANNVFDAYHATGEDCNGHGTHVAGTIGAATYGVAKGATVVSVRVLDCYGTGTWSAIIAGVVFILYAQGTRSFTEREVLLKSIFDSQQNVREILSRCIVPQRSGSLDDFPPSPIKNSPIFHMPP
jgi:subtilisin family serine protease